MIEPMKLLSTSTLEALSAEVATNQARYESSDFTDLAVANGWAIETSLATWDPAIVKHLDAANTPDAQTRNSLLIFKGMEGMTPALAREERLWARLCHVECLQYARNRWLKPEGNNAASIRTHFFAPSLPGCRDDNAIGSLWWNGHLANLASPNDLEGGLKRLLAKANIRLQIMDRADSAFRLPLVQGIFRKLEAESWLMSFDAAIAYFMFEVNKRSGGIVFEALDEATIDLHLGECLAFAKHRKIE
jgi:hypothetical protein